MKARSLVSHSAIIIALGLSVSGCTFLERLAEVGEPPKISGIQDPTKSQNYTPVSLPMPTPTAPQPGANSLWRPGARAFFKDQRATEIGDILTVQVNINESGQLKNQTSTATANSEAANPNFTMFGMEKSVGKVLGGASTTDLFNFGSTSGLSGTGSMQRQEQVTVNLAAVITQKLPNGNLVISGRQELRVNAELRELSVKGIIRPEDIASNNTISSNQIAEARISYGGRGTLSDVQTARYGQQLFDLVAPF
ncbi:MAG TPA: flagellar basal body L-ring protein FlgH [Rhodospirillaceae bacterium]|nr:flagellar basal body L-ring protein FlgH [Rhodospirillaceae bacterium]